MWNKRSNIVIGVILLATILLTWWVTQRPDTETAEEELSATATAAATGSRVLFPIEDDDFFVYISVVDTVTDRSVTVEQDLEGNWYVLTPERVPADPLGAQFAASATRRIFVQQVLSGPDLNDIASFGVLDPNYIVTVRLLSGTEYVANIGNLVFDGSNYYAQLEGDPNVRLAGSAALDELFSLLVTPPIAPSTTEPAESP